MAAKKLKPEDIQYMTLFEVSQRTTYSMRSVHRFVAEGLLKTKKLNNGKRVVDMKSFHEFLEALEG